MRQLGKERVMLFGNLLDGLLERVEVSAEGDLFCARTLRESIQASRIAVHPSESLSGW